MILIEEEAAVDSQQEVEVLVTTEEVVVEAQVLDNFNEVECEVKSEESFALNFQVIFEFFRRFQQ